MVELGSGHGRGTLYFARYGCEVTAADFSADALAELEQGAVALGLAERVRVLEHDVRQRLIRGLVAEIDADLKRLTVLRAGLVATA